MAGKTQTAAMLEALSDGRRWSTHELVEYGAGYAAHSRAADLRKLGYSIKSTRHNVAGENAVYFYELQGVPAEASRVEQVVDFAAAARLQALRVQQGHSVFQYPHRSEAVDPEKAQADEPGGRQHRVADRAGGPGVTEAPLSPLAPPAIPAPRMVAGGPSTAEQSAWVAELLEELAAIDDEISSLRTQLFLTDDDSARIDLLLAHGSELQERLDGLQARAA
jgi:hypothetical protein